jgi:hypothetical protein
MNLPRFHASASLGPTIGTYRGDAVPGRSGGAEIFPMLEKSCTNCEIVGGFGGIRGVGTRSCCQTEWKWNPTTHQYEPVTSCGLNRAALFVRLVGWHFHERIQVKALPGVDSARLGSEFSLDRTMSSTGNVVRTTRRASGFLVRHGRRTRRRFDWRVSNEHAWISCRIIACPDYRRLRGECCFQHVSLARDLAHAGILRFIWTRCLDSSGYERRNFATKRNNDCSTSGVRGLYFVNGARRRSPNCWD